MKPNPRRILPILVILLILGGGYYLYINGRLPFGTANAEINPNVVSGFIEGKDYKVASELQGRIAELTVNEGDHVSAGQVLARLDHQLLDSQIAQAQAAVDTAQAQLAVVKNSTRSSDVSSAQAALDAARQNYDKLKAGATASDLAAAQAAVSSAQQNYQRISAGPTADELAQLKAQADNARAAVEQAQAAYDKIGGASNPFIGLAPQSTQLQQATNNYNAALAAYNNARSHPTAAELAAARAQIDQAQAALARLTPDAAQLAAAEAQVQSAQAALARLDPTAENIAVAEAQVKQAEAARDVLQTQLAKTTITSPGNGIVTQRVLNQGEVAAPGAAILTVSELDPVELTIYVPETQLGEIQLGQQIGVMVDSFPGRVFNGKVIFISSDAEFTPRNVQTQAERVNTVFAVKLQIPNPQLELKPGMPADATLQ